MTRAQTTRRKLCRVCHHLKPITAFYRSKHLKEAPPAECKACVREKIERAQAKARRRRLLQKRRWYKAHLDYFRRHSRCYRKEHPRKTKAYNKKYYAEHKDYFRKQKEKYLKDEENLARKRAYNKEWSRRLRRRMQVAKLEKEKGKAAR